MRITPHLVSWQYEGYPKAHQNRLNLVIHVATAPIFVIGFFSLLGGIAIFTFKWAALWRSLFSGWLGGPR